MRLAVIGKGGVGKTTLAGTVARLLGREGRRVLAVDFDECPGLAGTLGLPPTDGGLPLEAVEESDKAPYGWRLSSTLDPAEAVDRFGLAAPDGVRFLSPGKTAANTQGLYRRSITGVRRIVDELDPAEWDIVADLAAGVSQPYEGYHRFADRVILVVTPAWSSQLSAHRLMPLVGDIPVTLVGSRFPAGAEPDPPRPDWFVPADTAAREADRLGVALIDHAPSSPVVGSLRELITLMRTTEVAA